MVTRRSTTGTRRQQVAFALGRLAIRDRLIPGLARDLQTFFDDQARAVVRRFRAGQRDIGKAATIKAAGAGQLITESDSAILIRVIGPRVQAIYDQVREIVPRLDSDRPLSGDIERLSAAIRDRRFVI